MVVTDYHKKRTMENVQMEGTMEFLMRWLCCTSKRSCESESCDRISTYWSKREKNIGQVPKNVTLELQTGNLAIKDRCKEIPLALDQHPKTIPLDHLGETPITLVLNVAKLVILPETALAIAKEGPEQISLISMTNTTTIKDSKLWIVLTKSNNNLMPCLLMRRRSLPKK